MRRLRRHRSLILPIVIYFTFVGGSFYSDLNFPIRVLNHAIVTGILAAWLIGKILRREPFPHTALDAPVLAWLAAHLITAAFGLSPRFSLEKSWMTFTHALAFYLLVDLNRKHWTGALTRAFYVSAAVVCVVGLIEFASWYFGMPLLYKFNQGWPAIGGLKNPIPPNLYRLNFTLTGSTPLSAYLALLTPPALVILLTARRRDDRKAIVIWLILAATVELISFSRGGMLALFVSLPLTALAWWLTRRSKSSILRRLWKTNRPTLIAVLVPLLLLTILIGPIWLRHAFSRISSVNFRFRLWRVAQREFADNPLTGVGPYNFGRGLLQFNDPELPRSQIMTAHNAYLNTAAEMGLAGLAAGAWLLLAAGRAWLARWRRASQSAERLRIAAAGAALAGLAAHSLVDTFAATPNVLPALAIAAFALTDNRAVETKSNIPASKKRKSSVALILALATLIICLAGLVWLDVAQSRFQRSVSQANRGDLIDAISAAQTARHVDPAMTLYAFQEAYLQGTMAGQSDRAGEAAVDLYQDALVTEPVHGKQTANLAAVLWQTGRRQAAIDALEQASAVDPDPIYLVNLGYLYQQMGYPDRAIETYGQALALSPQLAGSGFWQAEDERAEQWSRILSEAEAALENPERFDRWRMQIALAEQDWSAVSVHADRILDSVAGDCLALSALARAEYERGAISEAGQLALQALEAHRACNHAYVVRGLVHSAAGDQEAAETEWRTALFLGNREAAFYLGHLHETRGDIEEAIRFYRLALSQSSIPMNVEVTLYDRCATFDLLPPLFRIGVSEEDAKPWLALARLQEERGNLDQARRTYRLLLREDPYLEAAQQRLEALSSRES